MGIRLLLVAVTLIATVASATEVNIKSWRLPPATAYPHDAMVAEDGSIWYAALFSNTIGRFDPVTETVKEFILAVPGSGPHGLKQDADGNIWFTARLAEPSYIGKLNPNTGEFTEYPIAFPVDVSSPEVEQPCCAHSLSIDANGTIWFSLINADMLGKLEPSTGKMTLARSHKHPIGPYDVKFDSKGTPWYTIVRVNELLSVNPETMAIRTYEAPWPDMRPRRMDIAADDTIWYTDFARGNVGQFDPKTEKWKEWPSPGGRWSRPYGMVLVGDVLWYSENFMDPSTLVRFDTKTKEFRSWPVENCFDGAYYMVADAEDNLWFTCHDTEYLIKAEITED